MDEYQLVSQGEVFYVTELMTKLEGLERGPAGNTSLTAAVTLARQMDRDQVVVVQETEYTGAGKHHNRQLSFARENGIEVRVGDPAEKWTDGDVAFLAADLKKDPAWVRRAVPALA
jgi:cystathionine beta-synthase